MVVMVVFLEIMITLLIMMMIMMMMPPTAPPKGQLRHGHFLPKGMVTASSPLTVASRRRLMTQETSIYMEENRHTDSHGTQTGQAAGAQGTVSETEAGAWAPSGCPSRQGP